MLTKKECKWALSKMVYTSSSRWHNRESKRAKPYHLFNFPKCQLYKGDYKALNIIDSLIEEHFSNPPLKFEELKEGMWVWDDRDKEYIMVCRTCVYPKDNFLVRKGDELVFISKDDEEFHRMYRPNRFYRKEVQE